MHRAIDRGLPSTETYARGTWLLARNTVAQTTSEAHGSCTESGPPADFLRLNPRCVFGRSFHSGHAASKLRSGIVSSTRLPLEAHGSWQGARSPKRAPRHMAPTRNTPPLPPPEKFEKQRAIATTAAVAPKVAQRWPSARAGTYVRQLRRCGGRTALGSTHKQRQQPFAKPEQQPLKRQLRKGSARANSGGG